MNTEATNNDRVAEVGGVNPATEESNEHHEDMKAYYLAKAWVATIEEIRRGGIGDEFEAALKDAASAAELLVPAVRSMVEEKLIDAHRGSMLNTDNEKDVLKEYETQLTDEYILSEIKRYREVVAAGGDPTDGELIMPGRLGYSRE